MQLFECDCPGRVLRRWPKTTWLERHVLWRFGLYPWECVQCRRKYYRGDSRAERQLAEAKGDRASGEHTSVR